jgi:hypothetical protein
VDSEFKNPSVMVRGSLDYMGPKDPNPVFNYHQGASDFPSYHSNAQILRDPS